MDASMVKSTTKVLRYTKTIIFLVKGLKIEKVKALFKLNLFSWWPLLLCWILKCMKSSWDLQFLSLKVVLRSKWLSLNLDVDFMTLTISKLDFSFIFLEFIIYSRAPSHNFVKNHQLNVILSYFKQSLDNHLFRITYLQTTWTIF